MNRLQRRAIALAAMAGCRARSGRLAEHGREQEARREHPRADDQRARAHRIPPAVITSFTKATGVKVNYVVTGWDATHYEARRREHGAHVHRRRRRVRLVVHGPVRRRQVGRAARGLSPEAAPGRSREHGRCVQVGRQDLRGLLQQRLPHLDLQQEAVRQGGHHDVPAHARPSSARRRTSSRPPASSTRSRSRWRRPRAASRRGTCSRSRTAGNLFDKNFKPTFQKPGSAGYRALQWEALAVKKGWVSPGRSPTTTPHSTSSPRARPRSCSRPAPATS